jgi:hypothetical protein
VLAPEAACGSLRLGWSTALIFAAAVGRSACRDRARRIGASARVLRVPRCDRFPETASLEKGRPAACRDVRWAAVELAGMVERFLQFGRHLDTELVGRSGCSR